MSTPLDLLSPGELQLQYVREGRLKALAVGVPVRGARTLDGNSLKYSAT